MRRPLVSIARRWYFGPGSIEQAHTADEWVSLDEVHLASEILYRFVKSLAE